MSTKSGFPPENPLSQKKTTTTVYGCPYCEFNTKSKGAFDYHVSRYHEEDVVVAGGGSAREGGRATKPRPRDFGLPMWECDTCGYRAGPALLSYAYQKCQKWQGIQQTGKACLGTMVQVPPSPTT